MVNTYSTNTFYDQHVHRKKSTGKTLVYSTTLEQGALTAIIYFRIDPRPFFV